MQITTPGFSYDADGNLTADGSHSYQYDAEGHPISIDNGSTASFAYNALGQEAEDKWSYRLEYQYDPQGRQVGTYSVGDGRWWDGDIPWGNRTLTRTWGWSLEHGSAVGTSTMTTAYDGSVGMDEAMYPWGQVWFYTGDVYGAYFGGLDGDPEPPQNIYPARNRMYDNNIGRWFTPDPLGGNVADPQSLNRYSYVLNNPETFTDPSGLFEECPDGQTNNQCNS
ncbi:MAG: RHS repeat-associated core domain-containing protein, partial [Terriglobia bacterium]